MNKNKLNLLIENFPEKYLLRRYKSYIEHKRKNDSERFYCYKEEISKIKDYGWLDIGCELEIILDTYKKSNKKIEKYGVESIFKRKDIFELAVSLNPIYINNMFNRKEFINYIENKFRFYLNSERYADFENVFDERFPTKATVRKELSKYLKKYECGIINIRSLQDKDNIYFIDIKEDDKYCICITYYNYCNHMLKMCNSTEIKYDGLNSYLKSIEKGYIDYKVLKHRNVISNKCQNEIRNMLEGIYYTGEIYLIVSKYSTGIINSFIYGRYVKQNFELVQGDINVLKMVDK